MKLTAERLARIESKARNHRSATCKLTAAEQAELARMQAEHDALSWRLEHDPGSFDNAELDELLYKMSIAGDDGSGARFDELRRRARTPAEVAADLAHDAMLAALTPQDRSDWNADYLGLPRIHLKS